LNDWANSQAELFFEIFVIWCNFDTGKNHLYNARTMVDKNDIDDVVTENEFLPEDVDIEAGEEEELLGGKLKALRAKLALCEEEKRKHLEDLNRARADFLNGKRRLEEQLARDKERATDKMLVDLLTLMDSFDTAMADKTLWNTIDARWRVGVEAIQAKLVSILKGNGVVPLDPIGLPFNPEEHEAVSNSPVEDDAQVDTIVAVLQKGFRRNDTVIRPARVVVGTK
jgi:molecular chaperone GrpE